LINRVITRLARRQINRSMTFSPQESPALPPGDKKGKRLLYLHVPFCERLCPYCSFNRVPFEEGLCRDYFSALRKEILLYRDEGYDFNGIYVGGGTPTVLVDELESTLSLARECFAVGEISVETNPDHLTDGRLIPLERAGVKRLSVGIQSFDDALLKAMDRYDKYGSGRRIAERMKSVAGRFDTLNADMMFNFPSQTGASIEKDLDTLAEIAVDQVTYYPLMVSDSTRRQVEKKLGSVNEGREYGYYRLISRRLLAEYRFSSAWCFSRKTAEAEKIVDEYVVDYDDYAGLGSGSIGYLAGVCYANTFNIEDYIDRVGKGRIPVTASRTFGIRERIHYDFLMKLFGGSLDLVALGNKYGVSLFRYLWLPAFFFRLVGGIERRDDRLFLTERGRYYWVVMMREFFTAVNNFRDFCRS